MLVIITKKSRYPFLKFSWSAALSVSSSLARPSLSLPNSSLFSPENYSPFFSSPLENYSPFVSSPPENYSPFFYSPPEDYSLPNSPALLSFLFVARQSRGRCAAVTWGVARQSRGAWCAAVPWALRGRCAIVVRNPIAHRLLSGQRCFDGRFPTS